MKKFKIVLLCLAAIIALAVTWSLGMRFYYHHKFNERVAELKAQGFPVSLADLEKAYVLPEGVPNAADVYLEAFSHYQEPNEFEKQWLPVSGSYIWPDDVPPFPDEVMKSLESYLARNQKTLLLLDQAAKIEHCLWPRTMHESYFANNHWTDIRRAAQLLCERNLCLAQQDKRKEVFDSFQTAIALSETLLKQPFMIDYLVSVAMRALITENLEKVMQIAAFTPEELLLLQSAFERMASPNGFYETLLVERCCLIKGFNLSLRLRYQYLQSQGKSDWLLRACYVLSSIEQKDKLLTLDFYRQFIEAAQRSPFERQQAFLNIQQQIDSYSGIHFHLNDLASTTKVAQIDLRVLGGLHSTETALAIERYRLKYNSHPESLENLVPEFMAEVPRDPFDNQPLRYIRHDVGYTVYTIGEDGVDNGGISQEEMRKRNNDKNPDQYDWPFTVRR